MRKQIAAANWKMNMTFQQGEKLLDDILGVDIRLKEHQLVIFAVPFPYLLMTRSEVDEEYNYEVAAQNCFHKKSGAYTGEISAEMLHSTGVNYLTSRLSSSKSKASGSRISREAARPMILSTENRHERRDSGRLPDDPD